MKKYDDKSKNSILKYAQKLKGQTLKQACDDEIEKADFKGKGGFGQTLEKYYFGYEPNSNPEPDFKHVGMELKASPLKSLKNGRIQAKERIVLNIINYLEVHSESFEESSFWKKNAHLLLVFYHHSQDIHFLDYLIHLVDEWEYPEDDLHIIRQDWEFINQKIILGKAHELSEGDTFYLGACTKGSTAEKSLRDQPFNDERAKQRAYSLKQGYVNHIIANISGNQKSKYGKFIKRPEVLQGHKSIEEFVISRFAPFYEKSVEEIKTTLDVNLNRKSKNFTSSLASAILGIETSHKIEEFEKANIRIKAVRLKKNGLPKEHISFRSFEYQELVKADWEDCDFKNNLESKFFFVFFQIDEERLVLKKVGFWNMPQSDILEAKKVWNKTITLIKSGKIIKEIKNTKNGKRRYTFFPKPDENRVSHVRPHAKNSNDTIELPVPEKLTGANEYTKHCFWINARYVRDEIYLK